MSAAPQKKFRENYDGEHQGSEVTSSDDESELSDECKPRPPSHTGPSSRIKSTQWIVSGIYMVAKYSKPKPPPMQQFMDFIRELCFTKDHLPPERVDHMAFFFQNRLEVSHNSLRIPLMGFIQAKKETALYWANWLAQHHPEIKFQKVVGNIAFTSQYE